MSQMREAGQQPPPLLRRRNNHVPYDIVLNILTRLPVKSVIRFRCVCKSWYSSITCPNFISTHLNNNNKDHNYLIHMPFFARPMLNSPPTRPFCTLTCDRAFDTISKFEIPFTLPCGTAIVVGSCNGVLCLVEYENHHTNDTYTSVMYLWNPSIRKFKRLPDYCVSKLHLIRLGFAFHFDDNDYKVVKISPSVPPLEVEVYTLSSDSWRKVGVPSRPNVAFDNSNLVNIIDGEEKRNSEMILSFDVNSEKFGELALPDGALDGGYYWRCVTLFMGKLALIQFGHSDEHDLLCYIWVMKEYGVPESWIKLFVLPFERFIALFCFTKYGSILIRKGSLVSTNGVLQMGEEKFVLIDPETSCKKNVDIQLPLYVTPFMESLALLDAANVVTY
ncbi:F-box/kelch-repeat protein At3g06240-like [Fagus crenata]